MGNCTFSPAFIPAWSFVALGSPWIPRQSWHTWPPWPPSGEGEQDPKWATVTDLSHAAPTPCPTPSIRPAQM